MLLNLIIAALMMVTTTIIHAGVMMWVLRPLRKHAKDRARRDRLPQTRIFWVTAVILLMFLTSFVEVLVYAVTYLALNAIEGLEKALYFSMVTFTTLGYGDVLLQERWRLLASFEAANGIIMFGWSTAIIIAVIQRAYLPGPSEHHRAEDSDD